MNKPNKIIIHHSATQDGTVHKDFDAIRNYHINTNGWRDIGYHYVVESVANGYKIIPGRAENDDAAHCIGQNTQSIGICLVGNFLEQEPPEAQIQTLVYLIKDIYSRYGKLPIYGHKDFYATSCPGKINLERVKKLVEQEEDTTLTWRQIIQKAASIPGKWETGIIAAVNAAKADGDLGALEIFEFLPELIVKIYNSK
ncbi:peptidoglycan recognition family protein [Petroclostridium sp. X23]|uniref:peptidoglycan recognition protein family protein n=1 Tax=Petroclostridium sp. X23 TaxID=3045146 RepID=UPI0024AE48A5|nr:peptidoglycan recognition family protein [Petroclostridium sp. X23]WHH59183.1 peptidoglycan recognition family protein [Petroclostridium sp. X23]